MALAQKNPAAFAKSDEPVKMVKGVTAVNDCLFEQLVKCGRMAAMKHPSTSSLREMAAAIRGTDIAARQWLDEGFSPGDAQAYVAAGCFDVPRTAELRQIGIGPLEVARSGLGWDYCSGNVTLAEVRSMLGHGPKVKERAQGVFC